MEERVTKKIKRWTFVRLKIFKYIFPKEHKALFWAINRERVIREKIKEILDN